MNQVDFAELAREFEPDLIFERSIGFLIYYFFTLMTRFGLSGCLSFYSGLFLFSNSKFLSNFYNLIKYYLGFSFLFILIYSA